jgi:pimeloyl-ACP methyl ester carboxylesterase
MTSKTTTAPAPPVMGVLDVPGAALHYELRGTGPLLALVGDPMDADAFAPLADLMAGNHTVLTTDPRGIHRSPVSDPGSPSTPPLRADDLARLLKHLDQGPATVFGSSGGAATALALAQCAPELTSTVIAHEPPIIRLLPDGQALQTGTEKIIATYLSGDILGAWRHFLRQADIAMPEEMLGHLFGPDRDPRLLADERRWFEHHLRETSGWEPDLHVLRTCEAPVVVGVGEDSTGQLCHRVSTILAERLGQQLAPFPGGHIGFVDQPAAFAARLREVLASSTKGLEMASKTGHPQLLDEHFPAAIRKDGAFATYLELPGSHVVLNTRRAVKVTGTLDGHPFSATLMPSGEGPHWLPLRASLCATIGKDQAGQSVAVHLQQRLS